MAGSMAPTETVGLCSLSSSRIWVTMEVVVVLPWVPAMATDWAYSSMMAPSRAARVTM